MKKISKILAIVLMIILLLGVLCACNKTKNNAEKKRSAALDNIASAFLSGVDENWTTNMSVEQIASLNNAGEYVVVSGWTSLVCDVLNKSVMQTGKLNLLADVLSSEDGKTLIGEFSENVELLIPLLKDVGFTSEDISSTAYLLVVELTSNGEKTLRSMINTLDEVKDMLTASQSGTIEKIDNINENRVSTERMIEVIKMTQDERAEILDALTNAESAFRELVEFAYDTSVGSITDELYDSLVGEDGILGNVSEEEIAIVVRAMLANVEDLANAIGEDDIDNLNKALDLFIKHFDNNQITSSLYAQIVVYAKYAYMVVDVIPSICDVVIASGDVVSDADFVKDFLEIVKQSGEKTLDDTAISVNVAILVARAIRGIMASDEFGYDKIMALVEKVGVSGQDTYQKAMPLIVLDLLFNVSTLAEGFDENAFKVVHQDIITQDDLSTMLAGLLLNSFADKFKEAYYQYMQDGTNASYQKMYNLANWCAFEYFAEENNPYTAGTQTKAWYEWYMNKALPKANEKISQCAVKIKDDFKAFVNDYFDDNSGVRAAIERVANMSILTEETVGEDAYSEYVQALVDSRLLGFVYVLGAIA